MNNSCFSLQTTPRYRVYVNRQLKMRQIEDFKCISTIIYACFTFKIAVTIQILSLTQPVREKKT